MIARDLGEAAHVVNEDGQGYGGCRPNHAHAPENQPAHGLIHELENVLHAAASPGLLSVATLLLFGQRVAAVGTLADDRVDLFLLKFRLKPDVARIQPHVLVLVALANQRGAAFRVMDIGSSRVIGMDELGLAAHLGMVLIAVERLAALLGPAGINVLMTALVEFVLPLGGIIARLLLPQLAALTALDGSVLRAAVALARSHHEVRIHYLTHYFIDYQMFNL